MNRVAFAMILAISIALKAQGQEEEAKAFLESLPKEADVVHLEDNSDSGDINPFEDLVTPQHESYRKEGRHLDNLYCSEIIRFFPGWQCPQESSFGEGGNGMTFIVNFDTPKDYMLKVQKDKSERGFKSMMKAQGHPNIIEVMKAEHVGDHFIVIMEFAEFGSLASFMKPHRPLSPKRRHRVLNLFNQVVDGVIHIHSKDMVHADLKPANIVIDQNHTPKIIDFDLCVKLGEKKSGRGTSQFMAPEVYRAWSGPRIYYNGKEDVHALGVTFYHMATKSYPFNASGRKNVWNMMKKQSFVVKAGTTLDMARIYSRSLRWLNGSRATIKEVKKRVAEALEATGPMKAVRYDETLSTLERNFFIEDIDQAEAFTLEIDTAKMALWVLIASLVFLNLVGKAKQLILYIRGKPKAT